jgi:hypothetical protein
MPDMQTDVEVLKSELRGLQASMSDLSAKMDMMISMQVQLVRLQEQQDSIRQALDRAFVSIREHRVAASAVETHLHKAMGFIKGGALVGALLIGFVQWYVIDQINTLKAVERRVTIVESKLWPNVSGGDK